VGGCRHSGDRRPRQTDPVAVCDSVALICRSEEVAERILMRRLTCSRNFGRDQKARRPAAQPFIRNRNMPSVGYCMRWGSGAGAPGKRSRTV